MPTAWLSCTPGKSSRWGAPCTSLIPLAIHTPRRSYAVCQASSCNASPWWRSVASPLTSPTCRPVVPLPPVARSASPSVRKRTRPRCRWSPAMWRTAGWPRPLAREDPMLLQGIALKKYITSRTGVLTRRVRGWIKDVDAVSVQVAREEALGIVGAWGSGKTTLSKLLLLLERPTAGSLLFDGKEVAAFGKAD